MPKVFIEAAINGAWTRERQPAIPVAIDEIIADGIVAAEAGAAIIHFHAYDPATGRQRDAYELYAPVIEGIRAKIGNHKTYLTFDIDSLDPAYAPGTGTPEIGGLTVIQAIEIIRGCRGLNLVGADLVEVSPPFDTTGTTAITAANLLYEMLCVLPGVKYKR